MTRPALYAVRDLVAGMIVGVIQLHRHEAAAIRTFGDIASMPDSLVRLHPADFDLIRLGYLGDDQQIEPDFAVVITGAQWAATQQPQEG